MRTNVGVAKEEAQREVYRLTDMVVREVSIVDRPANLRPFLIMKSEGAQGAELEPDGMGGYRVKATSQPAVKAEPAPAAPPVVGKQAPAPVEIDDALVSGLLAPLDTSEVEKVGRKLASKREQAIRQAIELLVAVLDDASKSVERLSTTNKNLAAQLATAQTDLASLRSEHETLKAEHVNMVRATAKARGTVQKSNILHSEGQREAAFVWPTDLNS